MQQIQAGKISGKIVAKWCKMARSHSTGCIEAPPMGKWGLKWVKGVLYPILQANTPFFTVFGVCFAPKCSKFEAGKTAAKCPIWVLFSIDLPPQGILRLPNALIGYPNGLRALIPLFTGQYPIFTVLNAANSSGKNKRENSCKMVQNGSISLHRVYWGPPNG